MVQGGLFSAVRFGGYQEFIILVQAHAFCHHVARVGSEMKIFPVRGQCSLTLVVKIVINIAAIRELQNGFVLRVAPAYLFDIVKLTG